MEKCHEASCTVHYFTTYMYFRQGGHRRAEDKIFDAYTVVGKSCVKFETLYTAFSLNRKAILAHVLADTVVREEF